MIMQIISFDEYPSQIFKINLDNLNYYFKLYWNGRGEFWGLDVSDEGQNIIVSGIKLVLNYEMFQDYRCYPVPSGSLIVNDDSGSSAKIAYGDFVGTRALQLIYIPEAELATV